MNGASTKQLAAMCVLRNIVWLRRSMFALGNGAFVSGAIVSSALLFAQLVCAQLAYASEKNHTERNGLLVIEAEDFAAQHKDEKRRWLVFSKDSSTHNFADSDTLHFENASRGKYIEILPDTRTNHHETLVRGENFSNTAGEVAILSYPVHFKTVGKYYVWARAFSTGSEDNGIHIGLNGTWPQSAQRLQLCEGKHRWTWSSAQRIPSNHCGTPNTISLDITSPGVHTIMVSMREDGFELDKLLLTQDKDFVPTGKGPLETISITNDLAEKQSLTGIQHYTRIFMAASDFSAKPSSQIPLYPLEQIQALAINTANKEHHNTFAYAQVKIDRRDAGKRNLTLVALGTKNGASEYKVYINNKEIAAFSAANTKVNYQEYYFHTNDIELKQDDVITVAAKAVVVPENKAGKNAEIGGLWRALVLSRD